MDNSKILVLAIAILALGFSIYRKYMKKNQNQGNTGSQSGSLFSSRTEDDDYEPYSKK